MARHLTRIIALTTLIALLTSCAGEQSLTTTTIADTTPRLTVATYNVNYGMVGDDTTLEAIGAPDADVILLQETTAAWEARIRERYTKEYPHMSFKHCCGAGGLAVLSKTPFAEVAYIEAPEPGWFPALIVRAETSVGEVQLLNVHLRPPMSDDGSWAKGYFTTPAVREVEIKAYHAALDSDLATIIAGDFNEGDDGKAISFLREEGLISVLPQFDTAQNTWRWQTSIGSISTQLDHIVYNPEQLSPVDARALDQGRSDHLPVVAQFQINQGSGLR